MKHLLTFLNRPRFVRSFGALIVLALGIALASLPTSGESAAAGQTRHYYIAADEVAWDYAS